MSERLEDVIQGIDHCLTTLHIIYLSDDLRARVETEVWADLSEAVELGWYTQEEAQGLFMAWRHDYLGDT